MVLSLFALALALSGGTAGAEPEPELAPWLYPPRDPAVVRKETDEQRRLQQEANTAGAKSARPGEETLARMHRELADLKAQLAGLPKDGWGLPPADAAIYAEAVELQLKIDEWPLPNYETSTLTCLKWGRAVVAGLKADPNFMRTVRHIAPVGYRSWVDRSAQPYLVLLPDDYDPAAPGPYRLVVNLHGYSRYACPVGSIAGALGRAKDRNPGAITVNPFGRGNNWYTWAAEKDVWNVIADMKRRFPIDDNQIVLTGFSMGGGGTVALGLTHPGRFAAISPLAPAVFSFESIPTARDLPAGPRRWAPLTEEEIGRRVARVYAGPALAENARGVPWLLGCGGADGLLKAQESLGQAFDAAGVKYSSFVVPGAGHAGDTVTAQPEYRSFLRAHQRDAAPREVTLATTSLKSPVRAWVLIDRLTVHYVKAKIHAVAEPEKGTLTVTTDGIERFSIHPPDSLAPPGRTTVFVDGQKFPGDSRVFEKADGSWRLVVQSDRSFRKKSGLQGPIADAFTRSFLCVRPTGTPWNEAVNRHALAMLEALRMHWRTRQFGELPVKDDREVTDEDRGYFDLILFGDPGSNRLIAEAMEPKAAWATPLPLRWEKAAIEFHGETFAADSHLPVLIYPSPLWSGRYVAVNGVPFTRQRRGPNERPADEDANLKLLPGVLGDFAMLKIDPEQAVPAPAKSVHGGFFDEQWR